MVEKKKAIEILEELRGRRGCVVNSSSPEFFEWRHQITDAAKHIFPNENSYLESIDSLLNPLESRRDRKEDNQTADPADSIDRMWNVDAVLSSMIDRIQKYWSDGGTASNPQGTNVSNGAADGSEYCGHESLRILENILRGTAAILHQQRLEPKNETEMNRLMKTIVTAAFPDTVSSPPIPNVVKTFKPEFGVPCLAALAEYKFADSLQEAKTCVDGILADSRGYQTGGQWSRFYAVLFMTSAFFSQQQIDQQFKQSGISENWKAIVLVGRGGRKRKTIPSVITGGI
jgi:hypothetical protein